MQNNLYRAFILFSLFCSPVFIIAQPKRGGGNGTVVSLGPAIGFYKMHSQHAGAPVTRTSFAADIRRELKMDREYRTFLQFGVGYFIHGLSYASYYFIQDTLQLYNGTFNYGYSLYVHEINVPVQLKVLFNRGDNSLFSPYATVAYHFRYLLPAVLEIRESGNLIRKDHPQMLFRNSLIHNRINAFVSFGLGWQRNKISARGSAFFAEMTFRYGFSHFYFDRPYAASSVYIGGVHLNLMLGLKI